MWRILVEQKPKIEKWSLRELGEIFGKLLSSYVG